jgi:NAD(P)-dependent dehydrogenase (short-subunit alcohol dehydrogenase family)
MVVAVISICPSLPTPPSALDTLTLGTVDDVVQAVGFLCSAEADYITGSTLIVDGGFMANLRLPGWVNL